MALASGICRKFFQGFSQTYKKTQSTWAIAQKCIWPVAQEKSMGAIPTSQSLKQFIRITHLPKTTLPFCRVYCPKLHF